MVANILFLLSEATKAQNFSLFLLFCLLLGAFVLYPA